MAISGIIEEESMNGWQAEKAGLNESIWQNMAI